MNFPNVKNTRLRQMNFPNVKNTGQKHFSATQCSAERLAEGPKVGVQAVQGVQGVQGV